MIGLIFGWTVIVIWFYSVWFSLYGWRTVVIPVMTRVIDKQLQMQAALAEQAQEPGVPYCETCDVWHDRDNHPDRLCSNDCAD